MIAAVVQGAQQLSNHAPILGFELSNVLFQSALVFEHESS